jgi:hypothetical protein
LRGYVAGKHPFYIQNTKVGNTGPIEPNFCRMEQKENKNTGKAKSQAKLPARSKYFLEKLI